MLRPQKSHQSLSRVSPHPMRDRETLSRCFLAKNLNHMFVHHLDLAVV